MLFVGPVHGLLGSVKPFQSFSAVQSAMHARYATLFNVPMVSWCSADARVSDGVHGVILCINGLCVMSEVLYIGIAGADGCAIGRNSGQVAVWQAADMWV